MTDADKLMEMAQDQLRQAAGHQVFGRDKRVTFHRGRADLFRRAAAALRKQDDSAALRADLAKAKKEVAEIRRLREALTRYGARHDVDCPMNPESGYQPPLRCTCGLLEMKG